MARSRAIRIFTWSLLALLVLTWPAVARERWPGVYDSPLYFYSTDMSLVEVKLSHMTEKSETEYVTLRIPRAYILYASRYRPADYSTVPDAIHTNHLTLLLTYPNGKPLSVVAKELDAQRSAGTRSSICDLREQQYVAELSFVSPGITWSSIRESIFRINLDSPLGEYEGLKYYDRSGRQFVFFGDPADESFLWVQCYHESKPVFFCKAGIPITTGLLAQVDFVDFRFHGGVQFLKDRVRVLRQTVCTFVDVPC
jgi:hypothetical protein